MTSRILIKVTGWVLKPFTEMRKLGRAGLDSTQAVAEHSDLELQKEASVRGNRSLREVEWPGTKDQNLSWALSASGSSLSLQVALQPRASEPVF